MPRPEHKSLPAMRHFQAKHFVLGEELKNGEIPEPGQIPIFDKQQVNRINRQPVEISFKNWPDLSPSLRLSFIFMKLNDIVAAAYLGSSVGYTIQYRDPSYAILCGTLGLAFLLPSTYWHYRERHFEEQKGNTQNI